MIQQFKGNWSFSKLMIYESCAMRFKLAFIDKLPEPPRADDNPLERGNRVHKMLEHYVQGQGSLAGCEARAIADFTPALEHLAGLYQDGMATLEQDWIFDYEWELTDAKNAWLWMKLDANVVDYDKSVCISIDYKTGKSQYKAVEHAQQLQLYAGASALKYPDLDTFVTELWYVDEGHVKPMTYTREQALMFIGRFQTRADKIYNEKYWRANANKVTCRYCPYSPRGTGACPVGV